MSKLDDWAATQWAGMKQGASEIGRDIVADVGSTYQSFLMSDAGWRVPRAHGDFALEIAEEAVAAEIEEEITAPTPQPDAGIEPETDR